MKPAESPSSASYVGHVKNGVVILDAHVSLTEGQAVRIEPLAQDTTNQLDAERADRVRQLQQLFDEWTDEDGKLSPEDADRLHAALETNRGISFRSATLE